ncbi:hypothetical protein RND71_025626 [Anisodus tanguticus]|uniref:RNase H type-1 domain-containing protein n=1 Tax=Anisodus tanguticus TaxID=243964 RepID=A0AAE1RS45_9SOLA|nr:hypothetical protein RND71_025626 [Anisodus tanguticus]
MAGRNLQNRNSVTKWKKSNENEIKCNTNVSFDIHNNLPRAGMLIRTDRGDFIGGQARFLNNVPSSFVVEIMDVREALSWLKNNFFNSYVVIETDNQLVHQTLE